MSHPTYYLSSLDSVRFAPVCECSFERYLNFNTSKRAVRARIAPGFSGQDFGLADDIEIVIIATPHEGAILESVDTFPCFVFIAIPRLWDAEDTA